MLTNPDFFTLLDGFNTFKGVSFVSSFKIIEEELLPRFKQIDLVLGLEDSQTSHRLNQVFNVSQKSQALADVGSQFIERLIDGTLHLKFTKGPLFHSKYFLVENSTDFRIFNGSMNLTRQATSSNHEVMWMYSGKKNLTDPLYQAHQNLFKNNFTVDSAEFLERKIIDNLRGKNSQELGELLVDYLVDQVANNELDFSPMEIKRVVKAEQPEDKYQMVPETTAKIIRQLYTAKGNKRRTLEKSRMKVKEIVYHAADPGAVRQEVTAEEFYPQPMWSYNDEGEIIVQDSDHFYYPLAASIDDISESDMVNFVQIIKSFKYNKIRDESQQALSAFMYLMTAPLIWKIRQIYRESNFVKSPDQVPVSMVLIGRGTTGKTLLVRDYFKRFIGDTSDSIEYVQINQGTSSHTNRAVKFLGDYLQSGRFISPMIIDELNDNFLHGKVSTNAIKQWSNKIEGIHNVNIFAMNHNAGSRGINNLEEITKRVYYLSFEAGWLEDEKQRYDYEVLVNNTNDHIYRYVTYELNRRLNNRSGNEESELIDDYLSQTRKIIKELLVHFGLANELTGIIDRNYNYKADRNRITWKMLIRDDDFKHVAFTSGDDQQFTVSKAIFNNLKGSTYENINQTLDNYFNMFPREQGVAIYQYDNGMILDIDKFDQYIGEPLIRNYYNRLHREEHQQDHLAELLQQQKDRDRQQDQILQNQTKLMQEMAQNLSQQPKSSKGLFSRWFHKK